jgi:hypothetical protein
MILYNIKYSDVKVSIESNNHRKIKYHTQFSQEPKYTEDNHEKLPSY